MPVVVFAVGSNDLLGEALAAQWSNSTVGLHAVARKRGILSAPLSPGADLSPVRARAGPAQPPGMHTMGTGLLCQHVEPGRIAADIGSR